MHVAKKTQKTSELTEEDKNKLTGRKTEKPRKLKVANERRNGREGEKMTTKQ